MLSWDEFILMEDKRNSLIEKYGDDFYLFSDYLNENSGDLINEMLNTYNTSIVIDKLKKIFPTAKFKREGKGEKENFEIEFESTAEKDAAFANRDFNNIINFYNYYVTKMTLTEIKLEPLYSDKLTFDEIKKFNYIFFHVTTSDNAENILKKGLRCKRSQYRKYPEKAFLCAFTDLHDYKQKLKEIADRVIDPTFRKDAVAIKINLRNTKNIHIYKDYAMDGRDDCFFTYSYIYPSSMSIIKI